MRKGGWNIGNELNRAADEISNGRNVEYKNKVIVSNDKNYHSAYLISTIVEVLKQANLEPKDLDCIAIDIGPGSFTGIRACTTVARMMAQQLNIQACGISSLEILSQINQTDKPTMVALDARKNCAYLRYDNEIKGAIQLEEIKQKSYYVFRWFQF